MVSFHCGKKTDGNFFFLFSVNHKTIESGWTETVYTLHYDVQRAGKDFHTIMIVIITF